MNYFVGYLPFEAGAFHTNSPLVLPPSADIAAEEDGEVFLIRWAKDGGFLISHMIISGLRPREAAFEVIPDQTYNLPELPIPERLLSELPQMHMYVDGPWLHPVDSDAGHRLHRISQEYLDSKSSPVVIGKRRTREKKEKGQKTAEEFFEALEKSADKRIGQGKFRDKLFRVYQGRCAISECSIDEVLSAVHIWDYSQGACQEVWNGILLRADIHLLFDRHQLRIFPGDPPIIVLDPAIQKAEPYKAFHLQLMRLPDPFEPQSNAELRRRWDTANEMFRAFPDPPKGRRKGDIVD